MPKWFNINYWMDSVTKFFDAWRIVRICPNRINAPPQQLSFNILTLAISVAIFVLARASSAGSNTDLDAVLVASIISIVILFFTGFGYLIFDGSENAMEDSRKWGTFFVMMWLTSLLLMVLIDAILFWTGHPRFTTLMMDLSFGSDWPSPQVRDVIRSVFFGIIAIGLMLIKTVRMDHNFKIFEPCSIVTMAFGLIVNSVLLSAFIYGHLILLNQKKCSE
jgi:hypothetical protein